MTEAFLHYVWEFQYFNKTDLRTTSGDTVSVFNPGNRNAHAGPDFLHAKIKIGDMEWIGNVEIHIHSSSWIDHKHHLDEAYENVVLHVVWKEDKKIARRDQSELPAIELKNRVSDDLLLHYKKLINNPNKIPCAAQVRNVPSIIRISMVEKALMQRLENKALHIREVLHRNNNDWEETAYQMLCRNFGFKVNAEPFEQLALALPYKILLKHADKPIQVEALLFGQAGFLEMEQGDDYFQLLKREYSVLSSKYGLAGNRLNKAQWRFLRLRPANFPTLRLAQLSSLICTRKNIFSGIAEAISAQELFKLFSVQQSSYWQHHYKFGKQIDEMVPALGTMSVENIILNTAVPLLVAFGKFKDEQHYIDRSVEILGNVASEENAIVKAWREVGIKSVSAGDSQGLIELKNNFCLKRRCLDCNIGFSILQPAIT